MVLEFILCVVATWAFCYLSNSPPVALFWSGLIGSGGYYIYLLTGEGISGFFLGALSFSIASEILSRIYKMPVTVFLTPAIIPLVPGLGLYGSMLSLAIKDYQMALDRFSDSMMGIVAMAMAIALSGAIFRAVCGGAGLKLKKFPKKA